MTGMIQWGMRQNAEVANQMMAVERVLEYTQITPEPNLRDRGKFAKKTEKVVALPANAPKNWPAEGMIRFNQVYMRYAEEDPPVLKGLNIIISAGEKVCTPPRNFHHYWNLHFCNYSSTLVKYCR